MGNFSFRIDGTDLTKLVRTLWADEEQPEKALMILHAAFPEMTRGQQISILSGEKKLVGNEHVMNLLDDGVSETELGNPLYPEIIFRKLLARAKKADGQRKDAVALLMRDTVAMGSPKGLVHVPFWRTTPTSSGRKLVTDLDDTMYQESPMTFISPKLTLKPKPKEKPEPKKRPLSEPLTRIVGDSGWLTPNGEFYPCGYMEHDGVISDLNMEVKEVEKLGWIRMSRSYAELNSDRSPFSYPSKTPTQKQIDMIFDWSVERKVKVPEWTVSYKLP